MQPHSSLCSPIHPYGAPQMAPQSPIHPHSAPFIPMQPHSSLCSPIHPYAAPQIAPQSPIHPYAAPFIPMEPHSSQCSPIHPSPGAPLCPPPAPRRCGSGRHLGAALLPAASAAPEGAGLRGREVGAEEGAGLKGGWAGLGGIIETPQGEPERNHRDDIERPQHHTKSPTERTAVEDLIANTPEKP